MQKQIGGYLMLVLPMGGYHNKQNIT